MRGSVGAGHGGAAAREAPNLALLFSGAERGKVKLLRAAAPNIVQSSQPHLQLPRAPASERNTTIAAMIGIALLGAGIFARERKPRPRRLPASSSQLPPAAS